MPYKNLGQLVVGDVVELSAVVLGNDELDGLSNARTISCLGMTYCVARRERVDVQKGEGLLTLEEFKRGDITCVC